MIAAALGVALLAGEATPAPDPTITPDPAPTATTQVVSLDSEQFTALMVPLGLLVTLGGAGFVLSLGKRG